MSSSKNEFPVATSQSLAIARLVDRIFLGLTCAFAIFIAVVLVWITVSLFSIAYPAIARYGLGFLTTARWNPVEEIYGALPQIYGTIMSSIIALLIAVPLGVGVAIFLSEDFLPAKVRTPVAFIISGCSQRRVWLVGHFCIGACYQTLFGMDSPSLWLDSAVQHNA
jgi:phosphate transport system permease protein